MILNHLDFFSFLTEKYILVRPIWMWTQNFRPLQPFLLGNSTSGRTDGTDTQKHRSTYRGGAHLKMSKGDKCPGGQMSRETNVQGDKCPGDRSQGDNCQGDNCQGDNCQKDPCQMDTCHSTENLYSVPKLLPQFS